jgi:hypothetical protein
MACVSPTSTTPPSKYFKQSWADMCEEETAFIVEYDVALGYPVSPRTPTPLRDTTTAIDTTLGNEKDATTTPDVNAGTSSPQQPLVGKKKKTKPARYSRRQAVARSMATVLEEQRLERARLVAINKQFSQVIQIVRVVARFRRLRQQRVLIEEGRMRVLQLRVRHCFRRWQWVIRLRRLQRRMLLSKIRRRLRKKVDIAVTRIYLTHLHCHAPLFWMDGNCIHHLVVNVRTWMTGQQRQGKKLHVDLVRAIDAVSHLVTAKWGLDIPLTAVGSDSVGSMLKSLKALMGMHRALQDLCIFDTLNRHVRSAQVKKLMGCVMFVVNRRCLAWKDMMALTLSFCTRVPLACHEYPDSVLASMLMTVHVPEHQTDRIVQEWCRLSNMPAAFAFPLEESVCIGLADRAAEKKAARNRSSDAKSNPPKVTVTVRRPSIGHYILYHPPSGVPLPMH